MVHPPDGRITGRNRPEAGGRRVVRAGEGAKAHYRHYLMSPASYRLGLTATYPEASAGSQSPMIRQPAPGWDLATEHRSLESLIGPAVYVKNIDELTGKHIG